MISELNKRGKGEIYRKGDTKYWNFWNTEGNKNRELIAKKRREKINKWSFICYKLRVISLIKRISLIKIKQEEKENKL